MAGFMQTDRPLQITTPLGKDAVLLEKIAGTEAISELFRFQLDLLAEKTIPFDRLLGQKVTVMLEVPGSPTRYFNGIISRLIQDGRVAAADGKTTFLRYQAELVPQLWLLTKNVQSRIFQHLSIPAILKQVFKNLDVAYDIQGDFAPRDFCVQYRESDCAFVSRLMEEEGIFYYFAHTAEGHQLHVTNRHLKHHELPSPSTIIYDDVAGGRRDDARITAWRKMQEVCVGRYALWDHSFELPGHNLASEQAILDSVPVGKVTHELGLSSNRDLEYYDYPGRYAQRFAGIDKGGGAQASHLQKIFDDNQRTVKIRMEQEATQSLAIDGTGNAGHFAAGYQFTLARHFDGDGNYLLTRVTHSADLRGTYITQTGEGMVYENHFQCVPTALPYRPPNHTKRPTVDGTQTAVVVGPPGEEILCDKYGRVKIQFNWDRQGNKNADSSCWLRVAQAWAGKGFGALQIPRIGQEVIVDFLEGDPDRPIVVGNVYNAEQMPPHTLPDNKTYSGFKTRSQFGGTANANELRFQDVLGSELLHVQAEKNMTHHVENSYYLKVGSGSSGSGGGDESTDMGSGEGFLDQVFHVEAPQKIEIIEGESSELVLGLHTIVVVGGAVEVIAGLANVETVLTAVNYEKVVSLASYETITSPLGHYDTIIGPNFETRTGAQTETVLGARTSTVTGVVTETIIGDMTETITGVVTETKTGAVTETINGNKTETITGVVTETITGNATETITGNKTETVTGNVTETISGNKIERITGDLTEDVTGNMTHLKAGQAVHAHEGLKSVQVNGVYTATITDPLTVTAATISLTATGSITLTVGPTVIELTPAGVTIKCLNFYVNAETKSTIEALSNTLLGTAVKIIGETPTKIM